MKPLNNDDPGCNYTTSNCVIWQGPDIPCISLCKGDTVSDVVFKLATELCEILDILDVDTYDISCFNLTSCKPEDFKQLFQFLLKRVCSLEECTGCIPDCDGNTNPSNSNSGTNGGCPDCIVPIASCFYYTNPLGDLITSMQLSDYITAIGNRICGDVQTINGQQKTLNNHEVRIVSLEDKLPDTTYIPPTVTPQCVLPSVPQQMDDVLTALESQFCQLQAATGTPTVLYQNIAKQCTGLNTEQQLNGSGGTMSSIPGWAPTINNVGQALGNMWLTMCDMRQAIKTIQLNCCPTGCDGIELSLFGTLNIDVLSVFVTGVIPAEFLQCAPGTTQVRVTDSAGGSATFPMNLIGYLNNPTGFPINLAGTPVNVTLDLTIVIEPCLSDGTSTCQSYLSYVVDNSADCPSVIYNATQGSLSYSFNSQLGDYTYNIQLWNGAIATMLSNQIQIISGVQLVTGTFLGLAAGTNYNIRVVITPTACPSCDPTVCPFTPLSTNPPSCPAPESASGGISIP